MIQSLMIRDERVVDSVANKASFRELRQLAPDDICLNSALKEKTKDSDTKTGVQSIRVGEMVVRRAARGWFWSSASKSDSSNKEQ